MIPGYRLSPVALDQLGEAICSGGSAGGLRKADVTMWASITPS
jgi:hypothetical protein